MATVPNGRLRLLPVPEMQRRPEAIAPYLHIGGTLRRPCDAPEAIKPWLAAAFRILAECEPCLHDDMGMNSMHIHIPPC